MAEPYIGEIRMFGGNFPPVGWMFCEGQLLPISDYDWLFQVIGTTYGGDGQVTFGLPDLRGRIPMHYGNGFQLGETGGAETITVTTQQMPAHTHVLSCVSGGVTTSNPKSALWATSDVNQYSTAASAVQMGNPAVTSDPDGGSQPHDNFMRYLCVSFIISLYGLYPSPT